LEKTGGNAEVAENKGIVKRAIRKLMQGKKLKIDGSRRRNEFRRMGDEGKAIAIMGWGHLGLPFLCGREVEVRPGFTEDPWSRFHRGPAAAVNSGEWCRRQGWTGPLQRTTRRNAET
jgi:hypothetical protein